MEFAADRPVLLVLEITAEFLSGFFSAKRLSSREHTYIILTP